MKRELTAMLFLLVLAPAASMAAQHGGAAIEVKQLARETGLDVRDVQMVLGARTAFAAYRVTYDRVATRFERAVGKERYRDLMAGREVTFDDGVRVQLAER
ncbi:hypothetical protein [Lysobacter terrae]